MSAVYSIPAITVQIPRFGEVPQSLHDKLAAQQKARKAALDTLITDLFPNQTVDLATENHLGWWTAPTVKLSTKDIWPRVEVKWVFSGSISLANPKYLQMTYGWGYRHSCKQMRRLKVERNGEMDEIDKEKTDAVVAEFLALYAQQREDMREAKKQARAEEERLAGLFAPIKATMEREGLTFNTLVPTGGTILLTGDSYGPRVCVMGDEARLRLHESDTHSALVKVDLIPAFAAVFKRNSQ